MSSSSIGRWPREVLSHRHTYGVMFMSRRDRTYRLPLLRPLGLLTRLSQVRALAGEPLGLP
jgi:hypothetical protein